MNTQKVVSTVRKNCTLMVLLCAIIALVLSACGQNTVAGQSPAQTATEETLPIPTGPEGSRSISPTPGSVESFWPDMAGVSWGPNTTYLGTSEVSPIYSPGPKAGDINAVGKEGGKCIVVYAKTRGDGADRFGVFVYVEYKLQGQDMMWGFGKDNVDADASDQFVRHFDAYCNR